MKFALAFTTGFYLLIGDVLRITRPDWGLFLQNLIIATLIGEGVRIYLRRSGRGPRWWELMGPVLLGTLVWSLVAIGEQTMSGALVLGLYTGLRYGGGLALVSYARGLAPNASSAEPA